MNTAVGGASAVGASETNGCAYHKMESRRGDERGGIFTSIVVSTALTGLQFFFGMLRGFCSRILHIQTIDPRMGDENRIHRHHYSCRPYGAPIPYWHIPWVSLAPAALAPPTAVFKSPLRGSSYVKSIELI